MIIKTELQHVLDMLNFDKLTYENRSEYKAQIDKVAEDVKTIFDVANRAAVDVAAANSAYNAKVTAFVRTLKGDYTTSVGSLSDVINNNKPVTDSNKAEVEKAIKLYNEISEVTNGNDPWLVTNAADYNKLVAALKVYQDAQQAAEDRVDLAKATVTLEKSL